MGQVSSAAVIATVVTLTRGDQERADEAVRRLRVRVAATARVRRDGAWVEVPHRRMVVLMTGMLDGDCAVWSASTPMVSVKSRSGVTVSRRPA